MREAFGGSWLLGFVVLFIVLFSAYLAISVNYTKAFKAKNKIVNVIEQNEGFDFDNSAEGSTQNEIKNYLRRVSYYVNLTNIKINNINDNYKCYSEGYCVEKMGSTDIEGTYYKVTTYVNIDMQVFNLNFTIPIQGETRKIERINT